MSGARAFSFRAGPEQSSERVDKALAQWLAAEHLSRSRLAQLCDEGHVRVDGKTARPSTKLAAGALVEVHVPPLEPLSAAPEALPLRVLYEDEHLLVVDKAAGMVVHPSKGHASGTLVNAVLHHTEVDDEGESDALRPGIVHRLDKDTSGVLVVARTTPCREGLKALFQKHDLERAYLGIAVGAVQPARFTLRTLHGRHPKDPLRFTGRVKEGREAVTHVEVLEQLAGGRASLCRFTLETGRTHQIRMHCAEHGFPLLGDPLYGSKPRDALVARVAAALGRQALHAALLALVHPITGKPMRWEAAPPEDFQRALAALRAG